MDAFICFEAVFEPLFRFCSRMLPPVQTPFAIHTYMQPVYLVAPSLASSLICHIALRFVMGLLTSHTFLPCRANNQTRLFFRVVLRPRQPLRVLFSRPGAGYRGGTRRESSECTPHHGQRQRRVLNLTISFQWANSLNGAKSRASCFKYHDQSHSHFAASVGHATN